MKCLKCEHVWTGLIQCHCAGCCRHFAGVMAFDAHRPAREDLKCQDPPSKYYMQDAKGVWKWRKNHWLRESETLSGEGGMVA